MLCVRSHEGAQWVQVTGDGHEIWLVTLPVDLCFVMNGHGRGRQDITGRFVCRVLLFGGLGHEYATDIGYNAAGK